MVERERVFYLCVCVLSAEIPYIPYGHLYCGFRIIGIPEKIAHIECRRSWLGAV